VPTAAAYKRVPFLAEKIHTIPRYLPDILLCLLAFPIKLAGAGRAPRAPCVPDDSECSPTCRRSRAAEKDPLRRLDIPASAPRHPPVSTAAVHLPDSLSLCFPSGWEEDPPIPIRFLILTGRAPLSANLLFFCTPAALVGRLDSVLSARPVNLPKRGPFLVRNKKKDRIEKLNLNLF
jgi:hypothetical protein